MNAVLSAALPVLLAMTAASDIPRPEHPRPDFQRAEWLNLNGSWEFAETDDGTDESFLTNRPYPDRILVPFCRESKLSGLERKGFVKNVWYRRTFVRPDWSAPRTLLHIGACDWRTRVWVNGRIVGGHVGGSAPIDCDVTDALKTGENTVIVHAFDDTRGGLQALGKQCPEPNSYGCLYTRTTGIWQTVWLEGVGANYLTSFRIQPFVQIDDFMVDATPWLPDRTKVLRAEVYARGKLIKSGEVELGGGIHLEIPEARHWSPQDPFLYYFRLSILDGDTVLDSVKTYAGMRTITTRPRAILLNSKPVFQRLVLDQGFYPDGVWTAPTDAVLKADIEMSMAAGFNGARLHQKVFEPRFLYWADRLGYLVWGEYPNWGMDYTKGDSCGPMFDEWKEVVTRDVNHPSIVGWCPFNETPGSAIPIQAQVANWTRRFDTLRSVIESSGYAHGLKDPSVLDAHDYNQDPTSFKAQWDGALSDSDLPARYGSVVSAPFMVSEYGGIGWATESGWGYGDSPKSLEEYYARYKGLTDALLDNRLMFGFCYTQLTDVEQERNGIYTFDRKPKFDIARIKAINARTARFESDPPTEPVSTRAQWKTLVAAFPDGGSTWNYTTSDPGAGWDKHGFDASSWPKGKAGFGAKGGWESQTGTAWTTSDIWVRHEFTASASVKRALLALHYDNATEVYLNGALIWKSAPGAWNDRYGGFDVTDAVRSALRSGGNVLAAHCHQDTGGQFLDMALLVE